MLLLIRDAALGSDGFLKTFTLLLRHHAFLAAFERFLFGKRGTLECLRRTLRPIILGCQVKSERIGDIQSYYSIICLNDPTYKIDC